MKKFTIIRTVMVVLSAILTLSFIILIATGISEIHEYSSLSSYSLSEEDYVYTLRQEGYMDLLNMTKRDSIEGTKHSETVDMCQKVALYYEAASLYKAYTASQDLEKASSWQQRMEGYEAALSDTSYSKHMDIIQSMLDGDTVG